MAKKENVPLNIPKVTSVPEGYKKNTNELVGFWNMEKGPIHFTPKFARVFDSDVDENKPSILIIGDSVGENYIKDKDKKDIVATDGQPIGVWYKPGMSTIKELAGVKVFMYLTGELDTGKPNKMMTFDVLNKVEGRPLMITEDYRKKSSFVELPFPIKGKQTSSAKAEDDDENFGEKKDIPF